MAALIRNVRLLKCTEGLGKQLNYVSATAVQKRWRSSVTEEGAATEASYSQAPLPPDRRLDFDAESLAARGYLRSQKPYSPPSNVEQVVLGICEKLLPEVAPEATLGDALTKYQVLHSCSQALQHSVPNSLMHKVTNVQELLMFYKTTVETTVPLEMMRNMELPRNLHVTYNYTRFHPETDTMFNGVSAFTKDSCIVTGLKSRKKYKGFTAKKTWPFQ